MTALFLVLAIPGLVSLLLPVLTYALFGLALARKNPSGFARVCRERLVGCLASGLWTSAVSQLLLCLSYPLGPVCEARAAKLRPGPGAPVVVCLHGLYHNAAAFLALRPALVRAGLDRVLCPSFRSLGTDFETEAGRLLAGIRRTVPVDAPLLFLGHSLGGLLARRLMAEPDIARRTLAAVTLGTPHRGTGLALLAVGRLGRSLRPAGPLLAALDALPDPPGATLVALGSPADNIVIPLDGLEVRRPGWSLEGTRPVSHVAMLYHPAVIARAVDILARAARAGRTGRE